MYGTQYQTISTASRHNLSPSDIDFYESVYDAEKNIKLNYIMFDTKNPSVVTAIFYRDHEHYAMRDFMVPDNANGVKVRVEAA